MFSKFFVFSQTMFGVLITHKPEENVAMHLRSLQRLSFGLLYYKSQCSFYLKYSLTHMPFKNKLQRRRLLWTALRSTQSCSCVISWFASPQRLQGVTGHQLLLSLIYHSTRIWWPQHRWFIIRSKHIIKQNNFKFC